MEGDWRKNLPSLAQALSHTFDTGLYSDFTFRIGPQLHKFNAHKYVVMSRSEVFAVMLHDRWNGAGDSADGNQNFIDIPHSEPKSFGCFLKYLYTDVLADPASVEVTLEVLHLAHMYQVPGLVSKSCTLLASKINLETCVQIFQATQVYSDQKIQLSKSAFDFVKRNIKDVLCSPSFLGFDKDGLIRLLQCDDLEVDETELFKALLRWSRHEEGLGEQDLAPNNPNESKTSRKIQLESLIPLIRFPLMGSDKFTKEVVSSKGLDDKTVIDMFVYFNGGPVDYLKFSSKPRKLPRILEVPARTLPSNFKLLKCYDQESQHHSDASISNFRGTGSISFSSKRELLSFRVSTPISFQGLRFYGVRRETVHNRVHYPSTARAMPTPTMTIDYKSLGVEIYTYSPQSPRHAESLSGDNDDSSSRHAVETVAAQKWNKVSVLEGEDFNLLFDKPAKIVPDMEYLINISLNVRSQKQVATGTGRHNPNEEYSISISMGDFKRESRQVSVNQLTMTLRLFDIPYSQYHYYPTMAITNSQGEASRMIHSIIYT